MIDASDVPFRTRVGPLRGPSRFDARKENFEMVEICR